MLCKVLCGVTLHGLNTGRILEQPCNTVGKGIGIASQKERATRPNSFRQSPDIGSDYTAAACNPFQGDQTESLSDQRRNNQQFVPVKNYRKFAMCQLA